jgi:transposase-like protein
MILIISLIGVGVVALITLIVFLVIRRKRKIANNEPVWYPFKKGMICPYCSQINYVRRRDSHFWCTRCGKSV